MIEYRKADIVTQKDIGLIIHQANCYGVFGAGIAGYIKDICPEVLWADKASGLTPDKKLGSFTYAECLNRKQIIVNIYSQKEYGWDKRKVYTDYNAMEQALINIRDKFGYIPTHAVPYKIGCGLARGNWNTVQCILMHVYEKSAVKLIICEKGK